MSKTVQSYTPKWAIVATWRRYRLFRTKPEAEARLREWHDERVASGMKVRGALSTAYTARAPGADGFASMQMALEGTPPLGIESARVAKLADHPLCYIGVMQKDVDRIRALEEENPEAFEKYSAYAKHISEGWVLDEAL